VDQVLRYDPGVGETTMATSSKSSLQELLDMAGRFVEQQRGRWEHKDWEKFLDQVNKAGVELTDEVKRNLGNVLEASKHFYSKVSVVPDKKKPRAKSKPKSKTKSKAKAKAKSKASAKKKANS
jgi:non-homologous end joining protein Ku